MEGKWQILTKCGICKERKKQEKGSGICRERKVQEMEFGRKCYLPGMEFARKLSRKFFPHY